jgi:hypothetical protein
MKSSTFDLGLNVNLIDVKLSNDAKLCRNNTNFKMKYLKLQQLEIIKGMMNRGRFQT